MIKFAILSAALTLAEAGGRPTAIPGIFHILMVKPQ